MANDRQTDQNTTKCNNRRNRLRTFLLWSGALNNKD